MAGATNRYGVHEAAYVKNKKKIMQTQELCGLCGKPVDKSLRYPDKWCATIDHIIPLNKGGHPSDIDNLQLAHLWCNRQKSDNVADKLNSDLKINKSISNRELPLTRDWSKY